MFELSTLSVAIITSSVGIYLVAFYFLNHPKVSVSVSFKFIITIFSVLAVLIILLNLPTAQDVYWNLIHGKIFSQYHLNPYTTAPNALSSDSWVASLVDWQALQMTHGPLWVIIMGAITYFTSSIASALMILRFFMLSVALGSGIMLYKILDLYPEFTNKLKVMLITAFLFNPFILQNAFLYPHNDMLIMFIMLLAFFLFKKEKYTLSAYILLLGVFIKYITALAVLIPVYYIIVSKKLSLQKKVLSLISILIISIALYLLFYYPFGYSVFAPGLLNEFTDRGSVITSSLGALILGGVFLVSYKILKIVSIIFAFATLLICLLKKADSRYIFTLPFIVLLFFYPWFQPWYVLWIFPLLALYLSFDLFVITSALLAMGSLVFSSVFLLQFSLALIVFYFIFKRKELVL